MKNRILITGLATATILSAAALNQLSPSVYAGEATTEQPASVMGVVGSSVSKSTDTTVKKTEVEKAKEAQKEADAKVNEAQAKVDTTTTTAKEADTKLEAEKKESADAEAAKTKAEEAKKTVDDVYCTPKVRHEKSNFWGVFL